ncbi:hypothetical protein ADEAN_000935300 [Angomonas deanei]|uniref:Uncharacterized protein n=1 Tax=Angomonas deanei TaxID=59799 RepID=A0A7G2CPQ8_9TRYP|nr:hypothetical protein ADEAN_000935300 [Angomonas deanei]
MVESAGEEETKRVDVRSELEHLLSNMTPLPTAAPKPSASAPPAAPEPHIDSDEEDYTEEERKIFDSIKMDISKEMMDRLAIIRKDR